MSKKHFEDVYGFLKELVHNEQDLETHRERIHAYIVVERVGEDNAAVVPDLLDLLSVEDELVKVNRQIQAALTDGGSSSSSSLEANGGEGGSGSGNNDGEDDPQKLLSTELEALGASSEAQESALEEALARAKRDPGNAIFSGLGGSSGYDGAPENGQAMEHGLLSGTSKRHQALCHAAIEKSKGGGQGGGGGLGGEEAEKALAELARGICGEHAANTRALGQALRSERDRQRAKLLERMKKKRAKKLAQVRASHGDGAGVHGEGWRRRWRRRRRRW